jgi:hypothetical protein
MKPGQKGKMASKKNSLTLCSVKSKIISTFQAVLRKGRQKRPIKRGG